MRNVERRLRLLERSPRYKLPPTPLEQIESLALRQVSDEDLKVMMILSKDREAGMDRPFTESELDALSAHNALRETEAKRMGFASFREAERSAG